MNSKIQKRILIVLALICFCGTAAAVKISLHSPASFPVDI